MSIPPPSVQLVPELANRMPRPHHSIRWRVATAMQRAVLHLGAERIWHLVGGRRGGATVLVYHCLADAETRRWVDPRNADDPTVFAQQIRFLAQHRRVVALSDLVAAVEAGKTLAPGSVAITFDDGYLDNYTIAAPILAHFSLPATFFLATGYVDQGLPQWVDDLHAIYRYRSSQSLCLAVAAYDLRVQRDVDISHALLSRLLLRADMPERARLLEMVRAQLRPTASPPRLTLDWSEVRGLLAMSKAFQVGVHTRDHLSLTGRSVERIDAELSRCVRDVRDQTGVVPVLFSFPYGQSSREARRVVSARFRAAVVTAPAALVHAGTDRFALPRVAPSSDACVFRFSTSGADPSLVRRLLRGA